MLVLGTVALFVLRAETQLAPSDPKIHLIGRFDRRDRTKLKCSWPATGVELRVSGQTLTVSIEESGDDHLQVEMGGLPTEVVALKKGQNTVQVALRSPSKPVAVRLIKRTEAFVGVTAFTGFKTDGAFLSPAKPKRYVEVIGDSISCGYGNEGPNQNEHFKPSTENAYMTYGSIAARAVGAEITTIAWSGRKMWPDNTIPEIYDLTVPTDPTSTFDFKSPAPSAIIVNLATNDFGQQPPAEGPWTDAYAAFLRRLRAHYPKAMIYPAIGSMMGDSYPPGVQALTTLRGYLTRMISRLGDPKVKLLEMDQQKMEDGIGSDWHPNVVTHRKMAAKLIEAWHRDLGW